MRSLNDYLCDEFHEIPMSELSCYEEYLKSNEIIDKVETSIPKEFKTAYYLADEEKNNITCLMLRELAKFIVDFFKSIK